MKRDTSVWSVGAVALVVFGLLAVPARAQHDRGTPTGGTAVSRGAPSGGSSGGSSGGGKSSGGTSGGQTSAPRGTDSGSRGGDSGGSKAGTGSRGNAPVVGRAVPRSGHPPHYGGGGSVPPYGGFYPWGWGFAGFYGGYYGAYDPWYGWYPTYGPSNYTYGYDGSMRLKVKPRDASVYVDGYYVGLVDDFDGTFQRLHVEAGPHRIEIRAPGFETLIFEVRIEPDHTTTYTGDLVRVP